MAVGVDLKNLTDRPHCVERYKPGALFEDSDQNILQHGLGRVGECCYSKQYEIGIHKKVRTQSE